MLLRKFCKDHKCTNKLRSTFFWIEYLHMHKFKESILFIFAHNLKTIFDYYRKTLLVKKLKLQMATTNVMFNCLCHLVCKIFY